MLAVLAFAFWKAFATSCIKLITKVFIPAPTTFIAVERALANLLNPGLVTMIELYIL